MVINGSPEQSISPKAQEVSKPLQKRVSKKEVQGFYYHAAEYQRARQKERNGFLRVVSGIAEPFTLHIRAARLRMESARKRGFRESTVLDNDTTKKLLEGKMSDTDIQQFRAKSQARTVFGKYEVGSQEDQLAAVSMITNIFAKKGELSDADKALYEREIDKKDLDKLTKAARENASAYTTIDELKEFADASIRDNLTKEQQELAAKLAHAAIGNSILTVLNYGKTAAVVAFLASNPVGWAATAGITLGSAAVSGATRLTRLLKEGNVHDISKSKGLDVAHKIKGWERIFGVDWDEDPANRKAQLVRASAAGALVALGARFVPTLLEHGGDLFHSGVNEAQNLAGAAKSGLDNTHGLAAVNTDHMQAPVGNLHENIHGADVIQNTRVHFLPDTTHHDWQQLHSYAETDNKGNYDIRLDYVGQDDGGKTHFIDLMMGGNKHVFVENNIHLATDGPHANDLITMYDTAGHSLGQIHSVNLTHELGLTNDTMKQFYTLSHEAKQGGLWHGTQDASDLQRIMFDRHLFDDGAHGNALYNVRIGGGYLKNGQFYVGASNHYFDPHLVNTSGIKTDFNNSVLQGDEDTPFRSVLAPELRGIDNWEDRGLEWLRENVFRDRIVDTMDRATDFGLYNTDNIAFGTEQLIKNPWLAYAAIGAPYVAGGFGGYILGRKINPEEKKGKIAERTGVTVAELALLYALPGMAVTAGMGYLAAKLQKKFGKKKSPEEKETTAHTTSQPASATPTSAAATVPDTAVASAVAIENLPASASADVETAPVAAPIPVVASGALTTPEEAEQLASTLQADMSVTPPSPEAEANDAVEVAAPVPPDDSAEATAEIEPSEESGRRVEAPVEGEEPSGRRVEGPVEETVPTPETLQAESGLAVSDAAQAATIRTDNVDSAVVADTPVGQELMEKAQEEHPASVPEEGRDRFHQALHDLGATGFLLAVLTPWAEHIGIPEETLKKNVDVILARLGKVEVVQPFIMLANKLQDFWDKPDDLIKLTSTVGTAVRAELAKGADPKEMAAALKAALEEAGPAGEAVASLGEEVFPALEVAATALAV